MADLLGGQVQVMFSNLPADEYVASGKLRALAVTTALRAKTMSNVRRSANSSPAIKRALRLAFVVPPK
jgi:tripartite-type tricarboxylate transporter receptor subunit TctC